MFVDRSPIRIQPFCLDFGIGPWDMVLSAFTVSASLTLGMPTSISSGLMSLVLRHPKHPRDMFMFPVFIGTTVESAQVAWTEAISTVTLPPMLNVLAAGTSQNACSGIPATTT